MGLKEKIILESLKSFSRKGFFNTSISDIMEASGASKGGLYNHFRSKDELFSAVLSESRKIWREKSLAGMEGIHDPVERIVKLLTNYRDHYLKDFEELPGGCIFVRVSVELNEQNHHLAREINEGFERLKGWIKRHLDEAKAEGRVSARAHTGQMSEIIFSGMLGASMVYGMDHSDENLNRTIDSMVEYLRSMTVPK
jgi:AcrR family transcriptional regulator